MVDRDDVCVLLPAFNEARTIESVIAGFRDQGFENVLVVDGGSDDDTYALAEAAGARVFEQSGDGKGQAIREAVAQYVEAPFVLMADADETYRADDAESMLEPLFEGRADHVIGDRFADMKPGAMTRLNQVGNRIINQAFAFIHGHDYRDILSGYRAFTRESFLRLSLSAEGFGIETEMAVECVKHGVRTTVVPITYEPRPDESETNLRPVRDGGLILVTLYRMAKTNNPLFYFGSVGFSSLVFGGLLGAYVLYDWFVNGVPHEIIATVGGITVVLGIQLVMFGVLSDMIVTVNREQTRQLENIAERLNAEGRSGADADGQTDATAPENRQD